LEGLNSQRQLLTSHVYRAAEEILRSDPSLLTGPVIVLSHPTWPAGVIGITASRLVERYHRPVIIFSTPQGEAARGSARSVEGLNITAAIAAQKDLLLGFGGHPMAAGLSLNAADIPAFTRRLIVTIEQMSLEAHLPEPSLDLDGWLSLPDVSLDLAAAMEKLAPYGPGNPPFILAIRNLTLVNSSALGWKSDHLLLTVADKDGCTGQIFWWNGIQEELPDAGSVFDLAFHLRTADFRGDTRVQLEFVDYRITTKPPVEVESRRFEIIDYRQAPDPFDTLKTLKVDVPGLLIWAEADDRIELGGLDRNHLHETDKLAIWTTPASPDLFRFALDAVKPRTIYLFAVSPSADLPESFLHRLAGLVKFTINQRKGHVPLSELASATAHREVTVRFALEWLAAAGHITLELDANDLILSPGSQPANPILQHELLTALEGLLSETSAYRLYFTRMSTSQLQ
jgi:single-stranded-DNA-specific exonuclease